jgi:hypothetical protein
MVALLMSVLRTQYMLTKRFGFKEEEITMLLDDSSEPNAWPTGNNMRYHMQQLVAGAQSGDSLLFHFSGEDPLVMRVAGMRGYLGQLAQ